MPQPDRHLDTEAFARNHVRENRECDPDGISQCYGAEREVPLFFLQRRPHQKDRSAKSGAARHFFPQPEVKEASDSMRLSGFMQFAAKRSVSYITIFRIGKIFSIAEEAEHISR